MRLYLEPHKIGDDYRVWGWKLVLWVEEIKYMDHGECTHAHNNTSCDQECESCV